ncbi:MAG: ATPase [Pseudomonadota bacterium]
MARRARVVYDRKACRLTLMGMSGVGKTRLARRLPRETWFHFSGDYRIGTKYLTEPMVDLLKRRAFLDAELGPLLRADTIHLGVNVSFDDLSALSYFLGRLGDERKGGLGADAFFKRQDSFRQAEIKAMRDVPAFIERAQEIYGYPCFINDAGGSLCEIMGNPDGQEDVSTIISEHTVLVYIKAGPQVQEALLERALNAPKPMYFGKDFLTRSIDQFCQEHTIRGVQDMDPNLFYRWVFPRLIDYRNKLYDDLAQRYGITITTDQLAKIENYHDPRDVENAFLNMIEEAIAQVSYAD